GPATESVEVASALAARLFSTPVKQSNPINTVAAAGAAPVSGSGGGTACVRTGTCQSRRIAGPMTCQIANANNTHTNAGAPFGIRSAVHASSIQPSTRPTALVAPSFLRHA